VCYSPWQTFVFFSIALHWSQTYDFRLQFIMPTSSNFLQLNRATWQPVYLLVKFYRKQFLISDRMHIQWQVCRNIIHSIKELSVETAARDRNCIYWISCHLLHLRSFRRKLGRLLIRTQKYCRMHMGGTKFSLLHSVQTGGKVAGALIWPLTSN
jgi:hypothetical protein